MLTGTYPFSEDVDRQFEEQHTPAYLAALSFPPRVSEDAKDLVWKIFTVDQAKRISLDAVLHHPFFVSKEAAGSVVGEKAFLEKRDKRSRPKEEEADWERQAQVAAILAEMHANKTPYDEPQSDDYEDDDDEMVICVN